MLNVLSCWPLLQIALFGKFNADFLEFSKKILLEKPEIVIGIAKSENSSRFEKLAINCFNKTKKISSSGRDYFNLDLPENIVFSISNSPTDSFCNWTTYKIKEFLERNNLDTKLVFVHINEKDLNKIGQLLF